MRSIPTFLLFLTTILNAEILTFSPLPMDKAPKLVSQYDPMIKYIQGQTGYQINFHYSENYEKIIDDFIKGKLDIIELGPLPFVKLLEKYKHAKPFLTFLSKDGQSSYTCELLSADKNIKSINDIKRDVNIKLTRKISTCGYLMTEYILQKNKQSLENFSYEYIGAHSEVLLSLLLKKNSIGTVKSTILEKYKHYNFNQLGSSPKIPGFAFIANTKTVSPEVISNIQNAILRLKPLKNKNDAIITQHWSHNTKYGAIKTTSDVYKDIHNALEKIKIP